MTIMEKFNFVRRKNPVQDYCIQTIRFIKLLENSRVLLDLIADGDEKSLGEYILDSHYVLSLIDSVIERLGMIVHDACFIVPDNGQEFYRQYDQHKSLSRHLLMDNQSHEVKVPETDQLEPEYKLLAEVLEWLHGNNFNHTVMSFMRNIFFKVIKNIQSMTVFNNKDIDKDNLKTINDNIYLLDFWLEPIMSSSIQNAEKTRDCLPLKHLLMETEGNKQYSSDYSWIATVGEFQLSLNSWKADFKFRLDANLSGYEKADFIFIYANPAVNLKKILPHGFHIEKTDYGQLAWTQDVSSKTIEDNLMIIGRKLFTENIWLI